MYVTSFSFGIGSLLVAALLKATPIAWVDKIKFNFNETSSNKTDMFDDILKQASLTKSKGKKSELERLLDS